MGVSWPRCLQIHDTFYFQTKLLKGKYSPDFEIWHSPQAIELIYDRPHFSASSVYEVSSKADWCQASLCQLDSIRVHTWDSHHCYEMLDEDEDKDEGRVW